MSNDKVKDLSQLIIVNGEFSDKKLLAQYIAKAPVLLITRCFKSVSDFIGNYESTEYEKDILHWINECDQKLRIVKGTCADDVEAYGWTAEMMGAPVKMIKHKEEIVLLVCGPYDSSTLNEIVEGVDEYN